VVSGRADSAAAAGQRAADQRSITALLAAVVADSTAIERGQAAQTALTTRATTAEEMNKILRKQMPGILSRCGASIGYAAVYSGGGIKTGPSVLAGCRVFP
jgi:hypothetical protein